MGKYLNVGNAGFRSIIGGRYVDKTGLIEYINSTLGTKKKLTCVSRPRRFGKSFAAQMLCAYYDKSCDSRELFQNFAIAKSTGFEQHLNQYNVIYLDITGFLWDMSISRQNADEYNGDGQKKASKEHQFKDIVELIQYKVMGELALAYPNVKMQNTLPDMLLDIAEQTGDKFIVIIDEWDALFREAEKDTEVQERYILLLRALFKNSGSTDRMIEAAYMTGILPIKKYGTHSAMTDFYEYTMLRPGPLKDYVGFTEDEVESLFAESDLDFSEAKKWYDGYLFGKNTHIIWKPEITMLPEIRSGKTCCSRIFAGK